MEIIKNDIRRNVDRNLEKLLLLSSVDGKNSVSGNLVKRLAVLVILSVHGILILRLDNVEHAVIERERSESLSVLRVIRNILRDDIASSHYRRSYVGNLLFGVNERLRLFLNRRLVFYPLLHDKERERLKSAFSCNRRAGLSLWSEGTVDVVHLGNGLRVEDSLLDLGCKLALSIDERLDLFLSFFYVTKVLKPVIQITKDCIVKTSRYLFSVSSDKGYRVTVVDHLNGLCDLLLLKLEFLCKCFDNIHFYLFCVVLFLIIASRSGNSARLE